MAYTTINKSSLHQNTVLYTGNASTQSITGVGFQPDLTWIKSRTGTHDTENHGVFDAVRTATKRLMSNSGDQEYTTANSLTAFDSDGFSLGDYNQQNGTGTTYASWNWKAGGSGSSNTDGTINTTATSVNTTAGFSISTYTGTGANATVGHGLGVAPKMIIIKGISNAHWWFVYHAGIPTPTTAKLNLNTTGYNNDPQASYWNSTAPTSSVFSIGTEGSVNTSNATYVAYCFADVTGYSKCGSYTGNDNSTFVYTGFKPKFLLLKNASATNGWLVLDAKRTTSNPMGAYQYANASSAEGTVSYIDFLSNGFRLVSTNSVAVNQNGNTFIYMAFGQSIVGTNNIPATAR